LTNKEKTIVSPHSNNISPRKSKKPRFLSAFALQDGLGFKKMKSSEIFRNMNELIIR
jgi:hypothetical protein